MKKDGPIKRSDLNSVALLMTAEVQHLRKIRGEKDTEFLGRLIVTYLNAVKILENKEES